MSAKFLPLPGVTYRYFVVDGRCANVSHQFPTRVRQGATSKVSDKVSDEEKLAAAGASFAI
jgi:hypothetical protein